MSILKKIFSSKDNTTITHQKTSRIAISGLTEIGNVNPVCPSCNFELDEKPERKKKCPHCGNNIFVRTRPLDRKKVLISDKQIDQLDFQWQLYNEHKERENYEQDPEYLKVRDELRKKFKREPSVSDVRWGLANLKVISFRFAQLDSFWDGVESTIGWRILPVRSFQKNCHGDLATM